MHNTYNFIKTLGPQAVKLITTLYDQSKPIFNLKDIQEILQLDEMPASNFIRKLVNRKVVTRLKPGLFILVPFELGKEDEYIGNPLVVAREIMGNEDYYISHGTAMEVHGMVTGPRLVIYVTTTKQRRSIDILSTTFTFVTIQKKYFFGTSDHWVTKQEKVRVSDLEKTVIDGLRQPQYCGGVSEVAKGLWMRQDDINIDKLINYALKMKTGSVIRRLGYILELYEIGTTNNWEILHHSLSEAYNRLDPSLPAEGKFFRRWRLQLNVSPEELLNIIRT